jgi:hypothetical protein
VFGFSVRYRGLSHVLRVFAWFIYLSGVIQFASLLLWYNKMNNMPLLHLYVAVGFVFLAWFYRTVLDGFIHSRIIWWVAILFVLFSLSNSVFLQSVFIFNSNALIVESLLIVVLSLFTFIFLLNSTVRDAGIADIKSISWINSGLFVYFLSSFLIYYFSNVMVIQFSAALRHKAWVLHTMFSIVMYISFLIALWKRSKAPRR